MDRRALLGTRLVTCDRYKARQKFQVVKHVRRHHPDQADPNQGVGKDPHDPHGAPAGHETGGAPATLSCCPAHWVQGLSWPSFLEDCDLSCADRSRNWPGVLGALEGLTGFGLSK